MKNKSNIIFISVIAILIVGAGSFYGGIKYANYKNPLRNAQQRDLSRFQQTRQGGGNRMRGNMVNGEIIKKDDKSITVKASDGGSRIIYISETTTVNKAVEGSMADIEIGKNIMATGAANSDGSIVAQSIQIRPNLQNGQNR